MIVLVKVVLKLVVVCGRVVPSTSETHLSRMVARVIFRDNSHACRYLTAIIAATPAMHSHVSFHTAPSLVRKLGILLVRILIVVIQSGAQVHIGAGAKQELISLACGQRNGSRVPIASLTRLVPSDLLEACKVVHVVQTSEYHVRRRRLPHYLCYVRVRGLRIAPAKDRMVDLAAPSNTPQLIVERDCHSVLLWLVLVTMVVVLIG